MSKQELYNAMVRLAQDYGYTTEETYEFLHRAIDSIQEQSED